MKKIIKYIPITAIILLFIGYYIFGVEKYFDVSEIKNYQSLSLFAYALIYITATSISIPGAAFLTIGGGYLFGQTIGTITVVIAATLGASIFFLSARLASDELLEQNAAPWLRKMQAGFKKNSTSYLLTLRLIPLFPFFAVNLVCVFLKIPFRMFFFTTLIGTIPGSFIYVSLGVAMREIISQTHITSNILINPKILVALTGLGILALLPVIYKQVKFRAKIYLTIFILCSLVIILTVGPYLPHPKRWPTLIYKQSPEYITTESHEKISVIIPTYNDGAEMLENLISNILTSTSNSELLEIIIIDGGSQKDYITGFKKPKKIITTSSSGGRGPAINAGIKLAKGNILLILHSDCLLEKNFDVLIRNAFANPNIIMTAFQFATDADKYPTLKSIENRVALRSKYLWLPYGDQALAIRAADLEKYFDNQIPNYKMMEDFELVWRVRDLALDNGKIIAILPQKVVSSPRRFLARGSVYTTMLNWFFVTSYVWGGTTPDEIFRQYYKL